MTDIKTTVEVEEATTFAEDVTNTEGTDNEVTFGELEAKAKNKSKLGGKIKKTASRVWNSKPMSVVKTGVAAVGVIVGVTLIQCLAIDAYYNHKSKTNGEPATEEETSGMIDVEYEDTENDTPSVKEETETEELGV